MAMQWQFRFEPAVWLGVVRALLYLGVGFGLDLTTEQMGLILTACESVFAAIQRSVVTPNART